MMVAYSFFLDSAISSEAKGLGAVFYNKFVLFIVHRQDMVSANFAIVRFIFKHTRRGLIFAILRGDIFSSGCVQPPR